MNAHKQIGRWGLRGACERSTEVPPPVFSYLSVSLLSSHSCFRINKHSVQVKDSYLTSVRLFHSYNVTGFVKIYWFLLKTDISLDNRISKCCFKCITFKPQIEFHGILNAFSVLPCANKLFIYLAAFVQRYNGVNRWNGHQAGGSPAVFFLLFYRLSFILIINHRHCILVNKKSVTASFLISWFLVCLSEIRGHNKPKNTGTGPERKKKTITQLYFWYCT